MNKILLFFTLISSILIYSQNKQFNFVSIKFTSICCGPPPSTEMDNYIKIFKNNNKIDCIDGYHYCCEQEGEFAYIIDISTFNKKNKNLFMEGINNTYEKFYKNKVGEKRKYSGGMLIYYYVKLDEIPAYMNHRLMIYNY